MLTLSKAALFLAFFSGWALLAQASASEAQPFGFRDVYIGMSAAAFEAKHPKFGTSAALPSTENYYVENLRNGTR